MHLWLIAPLGLLLAVFLKLLKEFKVHNELIKELVETIIKLDNDQPRAYLKQKPFKTGKKFKPKSSL